MFETIMKILLIKIVKKGKSPMEMREAMVMSDTEMSNWNVSTVEPFL